MQRENGNSGPMRDATVKNYIMAIYEAGGEKELVRTSDVAKALGYRPSSVTETFQKMAQEGVITYIPHRGVKLTAKGKEIAEKAIARRETLRGVLTHFGVPLKLVESECKRLEVVINEEVIGYINDFLITQEGGG